MKEFQEFILENCNRFLDDCQTTLDKNTLKPKELLETLNSVNEAIQLTRIPFLDILMKRDNNGI